VAIAGDDRHDETETSTEEPTVMKFPSVKRVIVDCGCVICISCIYDLMLMCQHSFLLLQFCMGIYK